MVYRLHALVHIKLLKQSWIHVSYYCLGEYKLSEGRTRDCLYVQWLKTGLPHRYQS